MQSKDGHLAPSLRLEGKLSPLDGAEGHSFGMSPIGKGSRPLGAVGEIIKSRSRDEGMGRRVRTCVRGVCVCVHTRTH